MENETGKLRTSEPKKTFEQQWDEYRQFWLDAIVQWREEGLITDDHLRRFPSLRSALEQSNRKRGGRTPISGR